MNEEERINFMRGPETLEFINYRQLVSSYIGFGLYKPLEERIKSVLNNLAYNTELYGVDSSIFKRRINADS